MGHPQADAPVGTPDPAAMLARFDGNAGLLAEVAGLFLEECPGWMAAIGTAVRERDAAALRVAAHTLGGSVGHFGPSAAYAAARQLEARGRAGDLTGVDEAYAELAAAVGAVEHALAGVRAAGQREGRP